MDKEYYIAGLIVTNGLWFIALFITHQKYLKAKAYQDQWSPIVTSYQFIEQKMKQDASIQIIQIPEERTEHWN